MIVSSLSYYFKALFSGRPGGRGGGVGVGDAGESPVICTTTFTNSPYPKPKLFNKKLLTPLPWGQRSVLCQVKKVKYFKRVLLAITNFLFAIIIHIRVN